VQTAQKAGRKNIKIAHKKIFSSEFFAPFNFSFLEQIFLRIFLLHQHNNFIN